jgi:drug/metabolite transporter (DMT)-like permease
MDMVDLVLGIGAAVGASTLYSLGIALQALDAREAPHEEHLRIALVAGLVKRARWLLGTGLSILGWPLQVLALLLAPLVVVQPALAAGLLVLLLIGERMLGEHAGRYEHIAMSAIVLGVLGAALTAPPRDTHHSREALTITIVLVALALASMLPYLLRALGRPRAVVTMVGAGLAFGWSGVATKLASDDLASHHLLIAAAWGLSTAAASAVGVLSESSALQSRPAMQVAPVVFVTQTVVPVVLAPLLLGERFSDTPLGGVPLIVSLLVLVVGAAMLARSPLLTTLMGGTPLMEGERVNQASGSVPSPEERSQETIRSSPSTEAGEPESSTTTTSPARIGR